MPVKLYADGEVSNYLDFVKEITLPQKQGYYLEAVAKLDAYLDSLLDSLIRQKYSDAASQDLLNSFEAALKKEGSFISGMFRLRLLLRSGERSIHAPQIKVPSKKLATKIKNFKEKRNKVLHSALGQYALVVNHRASDDQFQKEAERLVTETINLGTECFFELQTLLNENLKVIDPSGNAWI